MGMYDTVIVDYDILPLMDSEVAMLREYGKEFQTKDFENILTEVKITHMGIFINEFEMESVPLEERPYYKPDDPDNICNYFGSVKRVNERWVPVEKSKVRFYTHYKKDDEYHWFEFNAYFNDEGKLKRIERVLEDEE